MELSVCESQRGEAAESYVTFTILIYWWTYGTSLSCLTIVILSILGPNQLAKDKHQIVVEQFKRLC